MTTTRDEALTMLSDYIEAKDYEMANMIYEYICWLDRKKATND